MTISEIIKSAGAYAVGCRILAEAAPEGSRARERLTRRAKVMQEQIKLLNDCYNDVERVKMIHRFEEQETPRRVK